MGSEDRFRRPVAVVLGALLFVGVALVVPASAQAPELGEGDDPEFVLQSLAGEDTAGSWWVEDTPAISGSGRWVYYIEKSEPHESETEDQDWSIRRSDQWSAGDNERVPTSAVLDTAGVEPSDPGGGGEFLDELSTTNAGDRLSFTSAPKRETAWGFDVAFGESQVYSMSVDADPPLTGAELPCCAEMVSVDSLGNPADSDASRGAIADDGTVVYESWATNLGGGAADASDVFARIDGTTRLVSSTSTGAAGSRTDLSAAHSRSADISADGRWAVFESEADNFDARLSDTNTSVDVFVKDLRPDPSGPGTTVRVSVDVDEGSEVLAEFESGAYAPSISDDGRIVTFRASFLEMVDCGEECTEEISKDYVLVHDRQVDPGDPMDEPGNIATYRFPYQETWNTWMLRPQVSGSGSIVAMPYATLTCARPSGTGARIDGIVEPGDLVIGNVDELRNPLEDNPIVDKLHAKIADPDCGAARVSIDYEGSYVAFASHARHSDLDDTPGELDNAYVATSRVPYFIRTLEQLIGQRSPDYITGDPVSVVTGNQIDTRTDLPSTQWGMSLDRTYNSAATFTSTLGGEKWVSSFESRIYREPDADWLDLLEGDGQTVTFTSDTLGGWESPSYYDADLTVDGTDYVVDYLDGSSARYNESGQLIERGNGQGDVVEITYDDGTVDEAVHLRDSVPSGAALSFDDDDEDGFIEKVTASDGRIVDYTYEADRLVSASDPHFPSPTEIVWGVEVYEHNPLGRIRRIGIRNSTDPMSPGRTILENTFYGHGRIATQTSPDGEVTRFVYDRPNGVTTVTHDDLDEGTVDDTWVYHYDEEGTVFSIEAPNEEGEIGREFAGEKPTSVTDRAGATTRSFYSSEGYLLQRALPDPDPVSPDTIPEPDPVAGWTRNMAAGWSLEEYSYVGPGDPRIESFTNAEGETTTYTYTGANTVPETVTIGADTADAIVTTNEVVDNRIEWTEDADGVRTCFGYDDAGRVEILTEHCTSASPKVTSYHYNAQGLLAWQIDPGNQVAEAKTEYTYNGKGQVLTQTNPDSSSRIYTYYPGTDEVQWFDERNAESIQWTEYGVTTDCGSAGSLCRKAFATLPGFPHNHETVDVYDRHGDLRESRVSDDGGTTWHTTTYVYGTMGRLLSTTDPTGVVTSYAYDINGNLTHTADGADPLDAARAAVTAYDRLGRVATRTQAPDDVGSVVTTTAYDRVGRELITTIAPGTALERATTTEYYDNGKVKAVTTPRPDLDALSPPNESTTFSYTPAGRLACTATLLDHTNGATSYQATDYEQDTGLPIATRTNRDTYPDEEDPPIATAAGCDDRPTNAEVWSTSATGYDVAGRVHWQQSPEQYASAPADSDVATAFAYDEMGRVITTTYPSPASPTTPVSVSEHVCYTNAGDVSRRSDAAGNITAYDYHRSGLVSEVVDPRGMPQDTDREDVCQAEPIDPTTGTVRYGYDGRGLRTERVAYDNNDDPVTEAWTYDGAGRDLSYTDQLGRVTSTDNWIGDGVLTARVTTSGSFTDAGDPSGSSKRVTVAANFPSGRPAGSWNLRVDSTDTWIGTYVTGFTYDAAGNRTSAHGTEYDNLSTVVYDGTVDFDYNRAGNITNVTYPSELQASYVWDIGGRQTEAEIPNGAMYRYAYGVDRQVDDVDLYAADMWLPLANYTHNADGQQLTETLLGEYGGERVKSYSPTTGHLASLDQQLLDPNQVNTGLDSFRETTWDSTGRLAKECLNTAGSPCSGSDRTVAYDYDATGQVTLAEVTNPGLNDPDSWAYTYGNRGERLTQAIDDGTVTTTAYAYDDALQVQTADPDNADPTKTFTHDAAGRRHLETDGTNYREITYDIRGLARMTTGNPGGSISPEAVYDPLGYLSGSLYYDYSGRDPYPRLSMAGDEYGSYRADWGQGTIIGIGAHDATPTLIIYGQDPLGSISEFLSDSTSERIHYDPYGVEIDQVLGAGGYRSELTVNGEGLTYLRARWYDPETGTFSTRDPLDGVNGTPTVANPYHYADNDPLNKTDPTGMRPSDPVYKDPCRSFGPGYSLDEGGGGGCGIPYFEDPIIGGWPDGRVPYYSEQQYCIRDGGDFVVQRDGTEIYKTNACWLNQQLGTEAGQAAASYGAGSGKWRAENVGVNPNQGNVPDGSRLNAFLHMTINAYLMWTWDEQTAKGFADRHEMPNEDHPLSQNDLFHRGMDLANNYYGRELSRPLLGLSWENFKVVWQQKASQFVEDDKACWRQLDHGTFSGQFQVPARCGQ